MRGILKSESTSQQQKQRGGSASGHASNDDSYKKAHNDDFTLKPKPKYEWRTGTDTDVHEPSQEELAYQQQQQQQQQQEQQQQEQQWEQQQQQPSRNDFERTMIEVFPGMSVPLRGSEETQIAITCNQIRTAKCLDCTLSLSCVEDAEYILCPLCRCVSPLALTEKGVPAGGFGVGLGFVPDS